MKYNDIVEKVHKAMHFKPYHMIRFFKVHRELFRISTTMKGGRIKMGGMKLMKSKCDSLVCAVQNEAFSKKDRNRYLVQAGTIAMMCMNMAAVRLGADIWDKVAGLTSTAYTNILKIGSGIALVAFAIAALTWLFSKQQRRIDEAYDWMWRIVKGYVLLAGATFIFAYIANLFSDAPLLTNITLPGAGGGGNL